jgi:hypothetical protein
VESGAQGWPGLLSAGFGRQKKGMSNNFKENAPADGRRRMFLTETLLDISNSMVHGVHACISSSAESPRRGCLLLLTSSL